MARADTPQAQSPCNADVSHAPLACAPGAFETYSLQRFDTAPVELIFRPTEAMPSIEFVAPEAAAVAAPAPQDHRGKAFLAGFLAFLCIGAVVNAHGTFDTNNLVTKALPAAGAANASASINLFSSTAGRIPRVELFLEVPATPSLADAKTITLSLKDSADNVTFNAVSDIPAHVATGAGGAGRRRPQLSVQAAHWPAPLRAPARRHPCRRRR